MRTDWERIANTRAGLVAHWAKEVFQLRRENAELLEALRGLLAEDNMPASMSQHSIGAVKLALDAIKKAEGG
jgi:hypothetical protein